MSEGRPFVQYADTLLVNGRVRTLDDAGTIASAVAIADGRVVAAGDESQLRDLVSAHSSVIDVAGRTVLPAFIDSHTHLRRASLVMAYNIDYMELRPRSIGDVLAAVRERAEAVAPGTWIQGDSLATLEIAERRFPDRYELDSVAPRNPVVIRGIGRHLIAANSLALEAAGIDASTPSPPGGRIEHDESGEPNGRLHERAKLRLDTGHAQTVVPSPTESERIAAMKLAMRVLNSHGIAAIHEMAREPFDVGDYLRLREQGALTTRVRIYLRGIEAQTKLEYVLGLGLRSEFGDEWIRLGGVKFSIDGADMVHNAALYQDYPGEPGNQGILRIEADELETAVLAAHRAGLQVAVHAIGQRAVDMALDVFELVQRDQVRARLPHRIEHAYLPPVPGQLERMARLGLIWSTQPAFLAEYGEEWCELFGTEEAQRSMPLRTGRDLGLRIQLNSDFPCSPINPFGTLHAAVVRRTRAGNVMGAHEALTVDQALRYMTNAADYSHSTSGEQGRISPGCFADVMVTEQDPYDVDPEDLGSIEVGLTMVGGEVVHRTF
jgi:predicted amidohydrolase YtcJ